MSRLHTSNVVANIHLEAVHARNIALANSIGEAAARLWVAGESLVHAAIVGTKSFSDTLRNDYKRGIELAKSA